MHPAFAFAQFLETSTLNDMGKIIYLQHKHQGMNIRLFVLSFFMIGFCLTPSYASYEIKVTVDGYDEDQAMLGYYFGDKQYIKDTALVDKKGMFVFEGDESLKPGVYIVVLQPNNDFFQLLIPDENQHFEVRTNLENTVEHFSTKNGPDENQHFYKYLKFLGEKRPAADSIRALFESETDEEKKTRWRKELADLNASVLDFQHAYIKKHDGSLVAKLISAGLDVEIPEFEGTEEDVQKKRFLYYRNHYFDRVDMEDERLIRSPFLFQKIDYYMNSLNAPIPDSITRALDYILTRVESAEETFKFCLVHYLNQYAQSKIVGMDGVYVHLVENYYLKGKAEWVDEETMAKLEKNAKTLKPILVGKIAPDIELQKEDGSQLRLHELESEYTVLFFWAPDCGHCEKATPKLIEFYNSYKDKGVEVLAICSKVGDKVDTCWKHAREKGMDIWLNAADPVLKSRYKQLYDVKSTPMIYVLDSKKEIISKRIGAEQLGEVMDQIILFEQKKKPVQFGISVGY